MGIDAHLSLPPNVRVRDVASVLGILYGLPFSLEPLSSDRGAVSCHVRGATVQGYAEIPEMARIDLREPNGEAIAGFFFHFENAGGHRVVTGRARAKVLAAFTRVAEFFGGSVDYNDCDDETENYVAMIVRDDEQNCPEDGEPWQAFQHRLASVKPLTSDEIEAFRQHAAY